MDIQTFIIAMEQLINNLDPKNYQWRYFASNYSDYYKSVNQLLKIVLSEIQHKLLSPIQIKALFDCNYYVG